MTTAIRNHLTISSATPCIGPEMVSQEGHLETQIVVFLVDRKAQRLSAKTVIFYRERLTLVVAFCEIHRITSIQQLTPNNIREYLLWLESTGHNPGGVHCCYRALRAFLYWWEEEYEPPTLDEAIAEEMQEFVSQRRAELRERKVRTEWRHT